ncbi:MAG: 3-dehydroquinate synthase [Barnesiella sp.]
MEQAILFTEDIVNTSQDFLNACDYDRLFVLTDEHTRNLALPLFPSSHLLNLADQITIGAGDVHKNMDSLVAVWQVLSRNGATRKSLLVNLGGGMITDLGGFAASAFKRGIRFVNIPTTLLGAVDAAVGGKTGINFNGLKNEIGVFNPAEGVLISTQFLSSLSRHELLSGYAEMLKHGLISNKDVYQKLLAYDFEHLSLTEMLRLLEESVKVKEHIVKIDPCEKGVRKALNLGHTVGHAFESLSHEQNSPVPHGFAVAWGLVCELLISHQKLQFPSAVISVFSRYVYDNYGAFPFSCDDYEHLYDLMTHDKKNEAGVINFTLLSEVGKPVINQTADKETVFIAFDLYRDLFRL